MILKRQIIATSDSTPLLGTNSRKRGQTNCPHRERLSSISSSFIFIAAGGIRHLLVVHGAGCQADERAQDEVLVQSGDNGAGQQPLQEGLRGGALRLAAHEHEWNCALCATPRTRTTGSPGSLPTATRPAGRRHRSRPAARHSPWLARSQHLLVAGPLAVVLRRCIALVGRALDGMVVAAARSVTAADSRQGRQTRLR